MTVSAGSGFTVAKPSGVQDGDLLVMAYSQGDLIGPGNVSGEFTSPGWDFDTTSQVGLKIADSEPGSWTFTGPVLPRLTESAVIVTAWRIPILAFNSSTVQIDSTTSPVAELNGSTPYNDLVGVYGLFEDVFYPALVLTIGSGLIHRGGFFGDEAVAFAEPETTYHDATIRASVPSIVPSAATGGDDPPVAHTVDAFVVAETEVTGNPSCAVNPFDVDQRTELVPHTLTVHDPEQKAGIVEGGFGWQTRYVGLRIAFRASLQAEFVPTPDTGCPPLEVTFNNIGPHDAEIDCWWWWPDTIDGDPVYTTYEPTHTYTAAGSYTAFAHAFSSTYNAYAGFNADIEVQDCGDSESYVGMLGGPL